MILEHNCYIFQFEFSSPTKDRFQSSDRIIEDLNENDFTQRDFMPLRLVVTLSLEIQSNL